MIIIIISIIIIGCWIYQHCFFFVNALELADFHKTKYNTAVQHILYAICISLKCCSKYGFHLFKNNLINIIWEC